MNKIILASVSTFVLLLGIVSCKQEGPAGATIGVQAVYDIVNDSTKVNKYVVVDTRNRMDYVRGHLISAIWIDIDSLHEQVNMLPKHGSEIIVYDSADENTKAVSEMLTEHGFVNFYNLEGGFANWVANHYPVAIQLVRNTNETLDVSPKIITPDQVHEIVTNNNTNYAVIDVRSYVAFTRGHIKNAISIPYVPINEFVVKMEEQNFARTKPIIVYCDAYTCSTGEKAAEVLLRNDYSQVYILENGLDGWRRRNYPTAQGESKP